MRRWTRLVVCLVVLCAALRLSLGPRSTEHSHEDPSTACALRDRLQLSATNRSAAHLGSSHEVRLYWWFRFQGARRGVRRDRRDDITCAEHGLRCILDSSDEAFASSDAVVVWVGARPERHCLPPRLAGQPWVVEYYESPAYYTELWDASFMSQFSLKVSYEYDSDVVLTGGIHPLVEGAAIPPPLWLRQPISAARSAIVWVASNCDSRNRREELVRRLQAALPSSLPLHSVGRCLHNHDAPELTHTTAAISGTHDAPWVRSKLSLIGGYAFCLVLENSIAADYVTEKLFHAFAAGCMPIYYGTADVSKVLPHARAVVQVLDYPDVSALVAQLVRLAERPAELRARLAWREDARAVEQWWQALRNRTAAERTASKPQHFCSICKAVHSLRLRRERPSDVRRLPPSPRPPQSVWPPLMDVSGDGA